MSVEILLDTCAAIWLVDGGMRRPAADALAETFRAGQSAFVSPVTAWEIGLLSISGRFRSALTPQGWLQRLVNLPGVELAELTPQIMLEAWFLPGTLNRDPADRMIAATAREYGYTVMTRDRSLLDYGREGYLAVMPC